MIEVKGLNDEEQLLDELKSNNFYETDRSPVYRKRVAKECRNAINQLRDTSVEYENHLWVITLIAKSKYDPSFMAEQILGTLYKVGEITDTTISTNTRKRRCLYFHESVFHKFPELDGAIVVSPAGVALHSNDFGRRPHRLRQSRLANFFVKHSSYYDKHSMETSCDCFVADFDMDRRNIIEVANQLNRKYSDRRLQFMEWHRYEGIGVVFPPP